MEEKKKTFPRLADIENEVMAEMREWGRKRLEQRLQQLADQHSELFPPPVTQTPHLTLQSETGKIKLTVDYGQDPARKEWLCPIQKQWGLQPHQKITPGLADKLCFTATGTGSYEEAAAVSARWAQSPVKDCRHIFQQS